jgi:hypothetical protein
VDPVKELSLRLRAQMFMQLRYKFTQACGLAAPNLRVYQQYLLLRRESDSAILELLNPRVLEVRVTLCVLL